MDPFKIQELSWVVVYSHQRRIIDTISCGSEDTVGITT